MVNRDLTLTVHTSKELLLLYYTYYTHVATQCAAVTTHRLLSRAPPHDNFFDRNPDLIMAALNKYSLFLYNSNANHTHKYIIHFYTCHGCVPKFDPCPPTILWLLAYNSPQPIQTKHVIFLLTFNYCDLNERHRL